MSKLVRVVWVALVLSTCVISASAQVQPCPQGTMADVLGTTCSVGPLVLNFQNFDGRGGDGSVLVHGDGFIRPADIGFVPVQSDNQSGFKLVTNFVDGPGTDANFLGGHQILLGYGPLAAPNFEILGEDLTIDASAQASTQGTSFVRVEDGQDFPIIDFFSVQGGINSPTGSAPALHSHVNYLVPALASDTTSLVTFNADLSSGATGTASATLTSATFLYTMGPVVPAPQPAQLTYFNIDFPGIPFTDVFNINDAGQQVGQFQDDSGIQHGYVTEKSGGFITIDFPGATSTAVEGINNRGDIVGIYFDNTGALHGFLQQKGGTLTTIDFPAAILTLPIEINDKGQIVGEYQSADHGTHGFLLDNGQFSTIDHGPTSGQHALSFASGINDRGDIVGPFFDPRTFRGFLDSKNGSQQLDIPGQGDTEPGAINNAGDIVGTYDDINFITHGFLRTRGNFQTVDFPASTTTFVFGINTQQQIVGVYFDDAGNSHSFLAVPGDDNGVVVNPRPSTGKRPSNLADCRPAEWRRHMQRGSSGLTCNSNR
jgi:probable HAF family extracellular repeat protein